MTKTFNSARQKLRSRKLLLRAELACWVLGGLLLVGAVAARSYGEALGAKDLENFQKSLSAGAVNQALWSEQRRSAFQVSLGVDVGAPIAELDIPSLGLQVPVYEGTTEAVLNRGAGRIAGTAPLDGTGNAGIAAHRDGFFRVLKDVRLGEMIVVRTRDGVSNYRIAGTQIVEPSDVSVLRATSTPQLTLVTCYPFYFVGSAPQRFIVTAVREDAP